MYTVEFCTYCEERTRGRERDCIPKTTTAARTIIASEN
jgi:hypothetical protein